MKLYTDMPRTWEHENSDPSVGIMSDSMFHAQCVPAENSGSADLTGGGPTGKRLRSGFEEFTEEWTCRDCGTIRKFRVEDYTGWDIPEDAEKIAAALRGVSNQKVGVTVDDLALDEMDGNQNAEPRWSANRLEEVLREGLPDQNAEPDWEWGYGHESESGLVPVLGFEGRYSEGRSREIADKHAIARLRAATEGKSIREKVTIPVNTARIVLAALEDRAGLMVDDEDRIMDWMSSGASARIARVIAHGQKILDERFEDGVFE